MKDYSIILKSDIVNQKGEAESVSIYTSAQYELKRDIHYLLYDESELTGMEGTKTMLKYDGVSLLIKRFGTVNSELKINIGETAENFYKTPYGVFTMMTKGNAIQWGMSPLQIDIDYELEILGNGETNRICIHIEENATEGA